MLTGLNHLTLAVLNLSRSIEFYVALPGFKLVARWDTGAYLSLGDLWLCLSLDERHAAEKQPDYTHYAFSVGQDDFEEVTADLRLRNVTEWKSNSSEVNRPQFSRHIQGLQLADCCLSRPAENDPTQPVTIGSDRPESVDREVEPSPFRYPVDATLKANKHFTCLLVDFSAVQKISELPPRIGGLKPLIDAKITGLGPCNSSVQEGFYRPVFPVTIRFVFRQGVGKSQKGIGVLDPIQLLMKLHGFLRSKS